MLCCCSLGRGPFSKGHPSCFLTSHQMQPKGRENAGCWAVNPCSVGATGGLQEVGTNRVHVMIKAKVWQLCLQGKWWKKVINITQPEAIISFCTAESFSCKTGNGLGAAVIRSNEDRNPQDVILTSQQVREYFHIVTTVSYIYGTDHRPPLIIKS